jgi:DNA-directed RNA polymerase subunit omega
MLTKPSIESLLPKVDSRYTLAILVAKRARQIVIGAQVLVPCDSPNTVTQACEELSADRLTFVRGDLPMVHNREQFAYGVYVGLRPDVIAARMQMQDPDARSADLVDDLGEDLDVAAAVVAEAESEAHAAPLDAEEPDAPAPEETPVEAVTEAAPEEEPA